jgi:ABC-type sugar transport system substrate-binding protein
MNASVRRFVMLSTAGLLALMAGAAPAQAANDRASCVGIVVSSAASAGMLDVNFYKDAAKGLDYDTFGHFVADGAHEHLGSVEDCEPPEE